MNHNDNCPISYSSIFKYFGTLIHFFPGQTKKTTARMTRYYQPCKTWKIN
uniref:Uncharacterized protein n=1 Tax=Octopus bimaculoides TaxID=37653 RepID=A0A0L8FHJ3_OCTBM